VIVNDEKITKSGKRFPDDCEIRLKKISLPYVSRGALKLKQAFDSFDISVKNKTCVDLGASTGGFTEILLLNGAEKVFSVDVGYGQLHWNLRNDKRVIVMEKTNARYLKKTNFDKKIDFITGDLSFISLTLILPVVKELLSLSGSGVFLIKPQFELDREKNIKGIVKNEKYRYESVMKIISFCIDNKISAEDFDVSPIKGPKGNVEFLLKISVPFDQDKLINEKIIEEKIFSREDVLIEKN
jgi:23S rRNA (cytidine1920-2'-O)/16S rRNA (cytidine1409-2'-O)-methyltransferase